MSVQPSKEFKMKYRPSRRVADLGTKGEAPSARQIAGSKEFLAACEKVGAKPSIRQARNYRRKMGKFAGV